LRLKLSILTVFLCVKQRVSINPAMCIKEMDVFMDSHPDYL